MIDASAAHHTQRQSDTYGNIPTVEPYQTSEPHWHTQRKALLSDCEPPYLRQSEISATQVPRIKDEQPESRRSRRSAVADQNHPHPFNLQHATSFYKAASQAPQHEASSTSDLAKFLVRRELVNTGLLKFDDRPENYRAWKSSFMNTIRGLDPTASAK